MRTVLWGILRYTHVMSQSVTFIHSADLHLGAPFKGLRALSPVWADRLVKAIPDAFRAVIDTARTENVDFVIFAGDVFDNATPSYADYSLFIRGLSALNEANIPVYLCTGNHDPFTSWHHGFGALPENVHVFGTDEPTFFVYRKHGEPLVLLGGRGFYNQAWPVGEDISEGIDRAHAQAATHTNAPFAVGVIHTGLDIDPTRAPTNPHDLLRRDIDYWACGHIHQPMLIPQDHPRMAFSGCPQGRDIKETGDHGVLKITLETGRPNRVTFMPTARVVWQKFEVDVADCRTISEIQERIISQEFVLNAQTHCQNMVSRVTLAGKTTLHTELTSHVLSDLRDALNSKYPFFFVDSIVNKTTLPLSKKTLKDEGLFPAVYLSTARAHRDDKNETLTYLEKNFYAQDLSLPNDISHHFDELCDDAETIVLDLLSEGGAHG